MPKKKDDEWLDCAKLLLVLILVAIALLVIFLAVIGFIITKIITWRSKLAEDNPNYTSLSSFLVLKKEEMVEPIVLWAFIGFLFSLLINISITVYQPLGLVIIGLVFLVPIYRLIDGQITQKSYPVTVNGTDQSVAKDNADRPQRTHDSKVRRIIEEFDKSSFVTEETPIQQPLIFRVKTGEEICLICKRPISSSDEVKCPYCGRSFHYTHFAEWVRQEGCCPVCKKEITADPQI